MPMTDGPIVNGFVDADKDCQVIDCRDADEFSVTFAWDGDLDADWEVWFSNDEAGGGGGGVGFVEDTTVTFTTNPAGTPSSGYQVVTCPYKFCLLKLDVDALTSGDIEAVVCVKDKKNNR